MVRRSITGTTRSGSSKYGVYGKGKVVSESFGSSSDEESEGEDDNSYEPRIVSVGTGLTPCGQPWQFTCPEAPAKFEILYGQELHLDRGFDEEFMKANPFVHERVKVHD